MGAADDDVCISKFTSALQIPGEGRLHSGFYRVVGLLGALFSLCECGIKQGADEFGLVGVAFQRREFCQSLVFLGTDVGPCQLCSALSLVRHICENLVKGAYHLQQL